MGDRGFVVIAFPPDGHGVRRGLAVYTHWGGATIVEDASAAARYARPRVGDPPYFARMFVDHFTKSARDKEVGFGIIPVDNADNFDAFGNGGDYEWYVLVDSLTGDVVRKEVEDVRGPVVRGGCEGV